MKGKFCWALGLLFVLSAVSLAESPAPKSGQVPDATLAAMGLGGMSRMNDAEGGAVRGSFARAFSVSGAAGLISFNTGPSYSTTNPAFAASAAIGIVPGVRFSSGYAFAVGY